MSDDECQKYAVYKITGPKDLCYVGITKIGQKIIRQFEFLGMPFYYDIDPSEAIEERFKRHCQDRKKRQTALQKAMYRHGVQNFSINLLDTADSLEQARRKEKVNILKQRANLNTVDTKTLEGYFFLMEEMINDLSTTMTEMLSGKERLIRKTKFMSTFAPTKDLEKLDIELSKRQAKIDLAREKLSKIKTDLDFYSNKIVVN